MSSPGYAPLLLSVTLRLMRLIRISFTTGVEGGSVSPAQYRMLARLREGPATVSALAEWHAVTPPTATKVIDGLVERGWVERLRSCGDRRQVYVSATALGGDALTQLEAGAGEALSEVLANLTPEEGCQVKRALLSLASALPSEVQTAESAAQIERA
ncbi:MAG: MarR family winged helix-turn-helix transcriptional regulator [Anaerolineae bacterium]